MGERVLHPRLVPARRVVARAVQKARERERAVVRGVRHFLVAADALHRHHVRIRLLDARETVLVVDVDHEFPLRGGLDRLGCPFAPRLVAHVQESVLNPFDAPRNEEVENRVAVLLERVAVHVEDHAHALARRVVDNRLHVRIWLHGIARAFWAVPSGVQLDVRDVVADREVHAVLSARLVQLRDAKDLPRLDPGRVCDARRRVERVHEAGLLVRERHAVLCAVDVPPRGDVGKLNRGGAFKDGLELAGLSARGKADPRVVDHPRVAECGHPAAPLDDKRAFRRSGIGAPVVLGVSLAGGDGCRAGHRFYRGDGRERLGDILALRMAHRPAAEVLAKVERPFLLLDGSLARAGETYAPRDAAGQVGRLENRPRAIVRRRDGADGGAVRRSHTERRGGRHERDGCNEQYDLLSHNSVSFRSSCPFRLRGEVYHFPAPATIPRFGGCGKGAIALARPRRPCHTVPMEKKKTVTFRRVACKQNGNDFNERRSTMAIDINNANYKLFTDFAAAAAKQTPS